MPAPIAVDAARLAEDWEHLSRFRDPDQPGWTRRAFSEVYQEGREWLAGRMRAAGLEASVDAGGNLIGTRAGAEPGRPAILLGSHTDTVAGGGRFDGVAGVLAAIEAARVLAEAGAVLRHPLQVVDFLAEEPTDFGISTVGSRAMAGSLEPAMLAREAGGRSLADAVRAAGGRPEAVASARRAPGLVAVYLELHVEQGPVLERERRRLGVVTAITGIARFRLDLVGRPDHAGTMPMGARRDALAGAAEVALALESLWRAGDGVGTVGRLRVDPNATNVVPGRVECWAEMRSVDAARLDANRRAFVEQARAIAARRGLDARVDAVSAEPPLPIAEPIQARLAEVARDLGQPALRLPSFAGHDANQVARFAPVGMLFVPSRDGRSHCPEEWTDLADVALGAHALAEAVARFDARPP